MCALVAQHLVVEPASCFFLVGLEGRGCAPQHLLSSVYVFLVPCRENVLPLFCFLVQPLRAKHLLPQSTMATLHVPATLCQVVAPAMWCATQATHH